MLSVSLLGDFCIRHDEAAITGVDTPRLQSLLAYLMLHSDAPQPRAHLAFSFWPDTSESQAHTNLRNLLHNLRRALPDSDTYLVVTTQTLQWRTNSAYSLDVADFCTATAQATYSSKRKDYFTVWETLEKAVELYKGDLLPSCYDDWIIPIREELRQTYQESLERLVWLLEEQREYQAAIRYAQLLLRHDPLHEEMYRCLIRLHALKGDRAGALRVYHTCTTYLKRELGVEPSPATREAYEHLMGAEIRLPLTVPASSVFSPLVGREKEWAQMLQAWRAMVAGEKIHVLMLSGEAGIGKSRLAEELLQWAARQGIACASARCYAAEGELAYAPVSAWLRANPLADIEDIWLSEVARLLPEVYDLRPNLPRPVALTEAWQRERIFEALSRAVLGINQPLLLTIDDLQWCDRDTLEWLHFLTRFDPHRRLLVIGAYRPEEIGELHPLLPLIQALRLDGQVTEIELPPLDETATRTLATQIAGEAIDIGVAQFLYRETEGNPLFVVESVRAGLSILEQKIRTRTGSKFSYDSLPEDLSLPIKVKSMLEMRLAQLSPPSRELAGLAATIGREFSFELLAKVSGCDEDSLVRQLDELWQRRIIREHGTYSYDFSHDKLREVVYCRMSAARRRLLHRLTAQALEALYAKELDPISYQVAAHYERANLPEKAAPFYLRAAEVARQVFANDEAIALLQRGLKLVEDYHLGAGGDERSREISAQLWETLADLLEIQLKHEEALHAYGQAQARVTNLDRIWAARLHRKTAVVLREQRFYPQAMEACQRAEQMLGQPPAEELNRWEDEWLEVLVEQVWIHYWLAHWPEMDKLVKKLQPFKQARIKPASRMRFLSASCLMHLRKERYQVSDEMLSDARAGLALSLEYGSLKARVERHFELGFLQLWRGELEEAEVNLQAALELVEIGKILPLRTLCNTYLTVLKRFRGQVEGVSEYALGALQSAEETHMPDYVAAAKGNLAWLAWRSQNLTAAEQFGQEALVLWRQSPLVYPFQWQALWPLIAVALAQGRQDEVWSYVQALLEPMQQHLPDELNDVLQAAMGVKAKDQVEEARASLDHALTIAQEMGYI